MMHCPLPLAPCAELQQLILTVGTRECTASVAGPLVTITDSAAYVCNAATLAVQVGPRVGSTRPILLKNSPTTFGGAFFVVF